MRALGLLFLFLLLGLNESQAQILFQAHQKQSLYVDTNFNSAHFDSLPTFRKKNSFLSGNILNSRFESHVGGNDSQLQAVIINFDSNDIFSDSLFHVIPVGMARKGIYWGQTFVEFRVLYLDIPFVLCILPKDSNKFLEFAQKFMRVPDFDWYDIPQKKDSLGLKFRPINIDEYLLPLPCSHDEIYLEYMNDTHLNLSIDLYQYNQIDADSCVNIIKQHVEHLQRYHGKYCDRMARIYFVNRNVNMSQVTWFFEQFSELGVQLNILFSENTEK